jgi:TetR/AcrR family transcriptional repressor of nem operon
MARTKSFEPTRALDRALELFWCKGYSATSLNDLLEHMQISRQSLYDTFGDKHQLFLAALDRYCAVQGHEPLRPLQAGGPVREALQTILYSMVAEGVAGDRRGCFLVNSAIECAPHYPDIAAKVAHGVDKTEALLIEVLRHGQLNGQVATHHDPGLLARYLMTIIQGLRVQVKALPDPALLYPIIDLALTNLD